MAYLIAYIVVALTVAVALTLYNVIVRAPPEPVPTALLAVGWPVLVLVMVLTGLLGIWLQIAPFLQKA